VMTEATGSKASGGNPLTSEKIAEGFKKLQDSICAWLTEETGEQYIEDCWDYDKGTGGGRTRVFEGDVIEKGGVNFSCIGGPQLPSAALNAFNLPPSSFVATGVSIVIHPRNPYIPTIHMNVRYFEATPDDTSKPGLWWFGGGTDLTPYYPKFSEVVHFHTVLKGICDKFKEDYEKHKTKCDNYFFLKHRNEARGVGGIFFDHVNDRKKEDIFEFVKSVGYGFEDCYRKMFSANKDKAYTDEEREFQLLRRSRYVEFNLLWDRGTKFGIQSQGRTESILMSMPATAKWAYNWKPKPNSREEKCINFYLKAQDWLNITEPK